MQGFLLSEPAIKTIGETITRVRNMPLDLTNPATRRQSSIGGGGDEYNGMFTCVDASYTDDSDNLHLDVTVTVGREYIPRNGTTAPIIPTNAGVGTINGFTHNVPSVSFLNITSSGYFYVKTEYSSSSYGAPAIYFDNLPSPSFGDSIVIIGSCTYVPASGSNPAKIIVNQIWEYEQIIDYVFADVICS